MNTGTSMFTQSFYYSPLECIYHDKTIIPTTNILKRHENLFKAMGIDPIVLQNTKLKTASLNDDLGLVAN